MKESKDGESLDISARQPPLVSVVGGAGSGDAKDEEQEIDLKSVWLAIADARWQVGSVAAVVFVATIVICLFSTMTFDVKGSLYLGDTQAQKSSKLSGLELLDLFGGMGESEVATELEILKSRALVTQAILESGENVDVKDEDAGRIRLWRWLLSHRDRVLLEQPISIRSAIVTDPELADAKVFLKFDRSGQFTAKLRGKILGTGKIGQQFSVPGLVFVVSASSTDDLDGRTFSARVVPVDWMLEGFRGRFKVEQPKAANSSKDVSVIDVSITERSPFRGARFIDSLMRSYLDQHLRWKTEEADATVSFVEQQLSGIRKSLDASEEKLASYEKSSGTVALPEEAKALIEQQAKVEAESREQEIYLGILNGITHVSGRPDAPIESYLLSQLDDPVVTRLSSDLATSQQELKRLQQQFTDDAPALREQLAIVEKQREQIQNYLLQKSHRTKQVVNGLQSQSKVLDARLRTLPDAELRLATLRRELEVYSRVYSFLLEKETEAELTKASTISKTRILDGANVPWKEAGPSLLLAIPGGLFGGLLLAFGILFARHKLSWNFQSDDEVRRAFPTIPLFGTIPSVRRKDVPNDAPSIFSENVRSGFAEAYRLLRTNLYYSGGRTDKVIVVSSPAPRDGKTTTTLRLAHTLAVDGKRVLVIDADLRKPSHHVLFRIPQQRGLTSVLTGDAPWRDAVQLVFEASNKGCIHSLASGIVPPNPAELLSGPALDMFLGDVRNHYDFVLIDTPPFPLVSDALVIATRADRCFTVLRVRNSRRRPSHEHVRRLGGLSNRYGLIINDVSMFSGYGYGYGYASNYAYGYGSAPEPNRKRVQRR